MATFFGEILSVHSRAVEEDEEDENEEDEDILEELDQKRLACHYAGIICTQVAPARS